MAVRATKAKTYETFQALCVSIKNLAQSTKTQLAAGPTSANVLRQMMEFCRNANAQLNALAAVPGIANYAKSIEGDENYDIAAEFTAMQNALNTIITTITSSIPKGAGNHVLVEVWNADGSITTRTFSVADTATLRNNLDTLIASID